MAVGRSVDVVWGRAGRRALEVVRVVGDCAAPRVPAGAWVCVDRRLAPEVGNVVVVRLGGELTAKVLHEDDEGRWLVSLRRRAPVAVGPRVEILGPVITVLRARARWPRPSPVPREDAAGRG